jgi:hypothetical protein
MSWRVTRRGGGLQAPSRISVSSWTRSRAGREACEPRFFCQAVVGKHLSDESCADVEAHVGERLSDLIHIELGLEACADDTRFDLLGTFGWGAWGWTFGQEVGQRAVEDGVADVIVGLARLEAKAGGKLSLGEVAELPKDDHTDLLLDGLFLGEGDGLPGMVSEYEGAIFDQNVDVERDLHGHPLSRGGVDALERCRYVYAVDAQGQGPSRVEHEWTSCAVIHVYKCNDDRQGKKRGKAPTCCAITRYTSGKGHLPLDQSAMQPKGIMVTIRIGGEELL